jgi:hypothetical protein
MHNENNEFACILDKSTIFILQEQKNCLAYILFSRARAEKKILIKINHKL